MNKMDEHLKALRLQRALAICNLITGTASQLGDIMKDFPITGVGRNTRYGRYIRGKQQLVMMRMCLTNITGMAQALHIQAQPIRKPGTYLPSGGVAIISDNNKPELYFKLPSPE